MRVRDAPDAPALSVTPNSPISLTPRRRRGGRAVLRPCVPRIPAHRGRLPGRVFDAQVAAAGEGDLLGGEAIEPSAGPRSSFPAASPPPRRGRRALPTGAAR